MIVKYLLKVAMLGSTWVMYLLLALSVASIAVMVERWCSSGSRERAAKSWATPLVDLLEQGDRDAGRGTPACATSRSRPRCSSRRCAGLRAVRTRSPRPSTAR